MRKGRGGCGWGGKWRGGKKSSVLQRRRGRGVHWRHRAPSTQSFDLSGNEFRAKGCHPAPEMVRPSPSLSHLLFLINYHLNASICSDHLCHPPHLSCHFTSVNEEGEWAARETGWIFGTGPGEMLESIYRVQETKDQRDQDLLWRKQKNCIIATVVATWPWATYSVENYLP